MTRRDDPPKDSPDDSYSASLPPEELSSGAESSGMAHDSESEVDAILQRLPVLAGQDEDFLNEDAYRQLVGQLEGDPTRESGVDSMGRQLGRFEIKRRVGAGSFGIVYLAFDTQLTRPVALKLPRRDCLEQDEMRERFLREGRAVSSLNHPHIVQLFDAGQHEDRLYLAYQYCDGPTLGRWLESRKSPVEPTQAARLVAQLADAIQHAHENHVLHRDIKPSNVLLQRRSAPESEQDDSLDDSLDNFTVKLVDFGLAKFQDQDGDLTATGAVLGTFRYMSPEQASGRVRDISEATDVYGLGALLYQLLTREVALVGGSNAETLRNICESEPTLPNTIVGGIPRDLEAICLKCLEKSPQRRYASAGLLRDDLNRFVAGLPTEARHVGAFEQLARWSRRKPAQAALWGLSVLCVVAVLIGLVLHNRRLNVVLAEAQRLRLIAEKNESEAQELLYAANMSRGFDAWHRGDPKLLRHQLDASAVQKNNRDLRGIEWYFLRQVLQQSETTIQAHSGPVYASVTTPDGRQLVTAGEDRVIKIWDTATRGLLGTLTGHTDEINTLAISSDGKMLASVSDDRTVRIWDLERREAVRTLEGHQEVVFGIAFSPNQQWLVSGGKDSYLQVWSVMGEKTRRIEVNDVVDDLVFTPDGQALLAPVGNMIKVIDFKTGKLIRTLTKQSPPPITNIAVNEDGSLVAAAGHEPTIYMWDGQSGELVFSLTGHRSWIHGIEFAPDGNSLASSSRDGTVRIWPIVQFERSSDISLDIHCHPLRVDPRDEFVATGTYKGELVLLSPNNLIQHRVKVHKGEIGDMDISPDGSRILTVGRTDKTMCLIDRESLEIKREISRDEPLRALAFSSDGQKFAVTESETVTIWDVKSGQRLKSLPIKVEDASQIAFADRDRKLITVGKGTAAHIWDASTGIQLDVLPHGQRVWGFDVSPDGEQIATGDENGTLRVWRLETGELLTHTRAHAKLLRNLAYSPDGRTIATASSDLRLSLRDASTLRCLQWCKETSRQRCVAFSKSGNLVSASIQGHVQTWTRVNQNAQRVIDAHALRAWSINYLGDGSQIVSTGHDGTIKYWATEEDPSHRTIAKGLDPDDVALSANGRYLVTTCTGDCLWKMDLLSGDRRGMAFPARNIACQACSDGGRWIICGTLEGSILVWEAGQAECREIEEAHVDSIVTASFHPYEDAFTTVSTDGAVRMWNLSTLKPLERLSFRTATALRVAAFSADGRFLVAGTDHSIFVWDVEKADVVAELDDFAGRVMDVRFVPDSQHLVSAHSDHNLRLWNWREETQLSLLSGHSDEFISLTVAPDGRTLISGAHDGSVRLWHLPTSQQLGILYYDKATRVTSVSISADGRTIAAGVHSDDPDRGGVLMWKIAR